MRELSILQFSGLDDLGFSPHKHSAVSQHKSCFAPPIPWGCVGMEELGCKGDIAGTTASSYLIKLHAALTQLGACTTRRHVLHLPFYGIGFT